MEDDDIQTDKHKRCLRREGRKEERKEGRKEGREGGRKEGREGGREGGKKIKIKKIWHFLQEFQWALNQC